MKQKISIIAIAIMLVLVGCNSSTYMYDEWKSYVVGNKKGNLKIRYEENESEINLKISPYSSKTADECENIIKRSREFAEKNPDYLSDKIDINISFYLGSELIAIKFTNITNAPGDEKSIFYYDLTKLNMDCGEKPSYTYVVGNKKGNLKIRYEENESEINLKISPYSSKTADECENIIKRSREFAEKNPDYLSDKIDINISFYLGSELIAIKFTNITNAPGDEKSIFYYDLTKLNMDCGEKPSYTYVDYSILQDKVLRGTFDTEVIILELGENAKAYCRADVLELSKYFNSYQCIVANFDAEEPAKEVLQILKEKNPDADIYYTCYRKDLKKYE